MTEKKKQRTGDLRNRLIKAASEIISKEGIKKLTMRALSSKVGVSRTAAYRHFENKDALLFAIAEEGFRELTARYQKINRDTSLHTLLKLQNIGFAYINFAVHNPGAFRLMLGQEITEHRRSKKLSSAAQETFNEYLKAVKNFHSEKKETSGDYSVLAIFYWSTVHGLATLLLDGQIMVSGKNKGLPALLTEKRLTTGGNPHAMINFAKQTIRDFWTSY